MVNLDYLYNPEAAKPQFDRNHFIDKKLGFQIIENGMILPHSSETINGRKARWGFGGIIDSKRNYVKSTHVNSVAGDGYTPPPN